MARYNVTEIRNFSLSADGQEVSFVMATKFAGELTIVMPASCLDDLKVKPSRVPAAGNGDTFRRES